MDAWSHDLRGFFLTACVSAVDFAAKVFVQSISMSKLCTATSRFHAVANFKQC